MTLIPRFLSHRRRHRSRDERQAARLVAAICLCAVVIAVMLKTGLGVVE